MRWGQSDQQFGTELDNVLDLWSPWWRSLWGEDLRVPSLVSDGGPKIDVEETDDEVIVVAELPGLDKEHFTVEVRGNRLILRGEQRQETEERRRGYYYTERSYGSFARVIALPAEVDAAKAVAKYKNGLLRITLPKTARAKAKRYTVQVQ
jgi:HSP20 family protein